MDYDMSSNFEDPCFKESLAKYEDMENTHISAYFDADELVNIADYYFFKKKYNAAEKVIDFALQLHPDDMDALIFKSHALALKGDMKGAYEVADQIEDTTDREVKFLYADLLIGENKLKEADKIIGEIAAEEDYDLDTLLDIIADYTDVLIEKYARKWFTILRSRYDIDNLQRDNQRLRDVMAEYYGSFNEPRKAIPLLSMTLDEKPYSTWHWKELGKCNLQIGDMESAQENFDFALAIDDTDEESIAFKIFGYKKRGNYQEVINLSRKLLDMSEDKTTALLQLAKDYFETLDYKEALKSFWAYIDLNPKVTDYGKAEVCAMVGVCYAATGDPTKGAEYIAQAKKLDRDDENIFIKSGHFHLVLDGHNKEAKDEFDYALDLILDKDDRYEAMIAIASLCADTQNYELAIKYFELATLEYPQHEKDLYLSLSFCHFKLQQTEQCLFYLARIKYDVSELYDQLGEEEEPLIADIEFNNMVKTLKENDKAGKIDMVKYLFFF